jgi:hypothetical protein
MTQMRNAVSGLQILSPEIHIENSRDCEACSDKIFIFYESSE